MDTWPHGHVRRRIIGIKKNSKTFKFKLHFKKIIFINYYKKYVNK
jgi:hypothetical protein